VSGAPTSSPAPRAARRPSGKSAAVRDRGPRCPSAAWLRC
jgi:hypothetical protein